jgi:sugar/nucleoside kinase (ribokinase family)
MKLRSEINAPGAGRSWDSVLGLLNAAQRTQIAPVVAGFDGFVDTILHVVAERHSTAEYTRLLTLQEFAQRVLAASGGRNMNIEMVTRVTKIGGNGPILSYALAQFGIPVSYIGSLGWPKLHPVFDDFAKRVKTYSIGEPGYSDAIEFIDGKLVCGKQQSVSDLSWQSIPNALSLDELFELAKQAGLIAFLDWGIVFSMTEIMNEFLHHIGDNLPGPRKPLFIDTADPSKRSKADILRLVETLPRLAEKFEVCLGFNLRESTFIAQAIGVGEPDANSPREVLAYLKELRERLGIDGVVIHWSRYAAGTDSNSGACVEAQFTKNPKITTGAGDHFNAGFCLGSLLHGDMETNIRLGIATSGYYVREAHSPTLQELIEFVKTLS